MHAPGGHLTVICGPMFAGKTTTLIERLAAAMAQGHQVRAIKPARDTRYDAASLSSHAGARHTAINVDHADQIVAVADDAHVVGIDEAHFFGASLIAPTLTLLHRGTRVIVVGLERDHRGEPFDPLPRLLVEADEVVKLSGPCAVCGKPAVHTQRMVEATDRIVVGGAEAYQPRCRACFKPGR